MMLYWEVYEDRTHDLIGFVKTRTYEDAVEEAFKRYKRPVTLISIKQAESFIDTEVSHAN